MALEFYLGFGLTVASVIAGVWWRLQAQITEIDKRQASDLAAFKLDVATRYVSGETLIGLEKRLIASEERMISAIDKLTERLDRVIDRLEHARPGR